jgi:signal transduction histidine kinase
MEGFRVGGRTFALIGGVVMDSAAAHALARDPNLAVRLVLPAAGPAAAATPSIGSGDQVVREFSLPYLDLVDSAPPRPDSARFVVTQSLATLQQLRRSVDLWFLGALALAVVLAVPGADYISRRISRPLRELAVKTAAIDLDRLDQNFSTDRDDEIGTLSAVLGAMTTRLRIGSTKLREAERRATVGDLARQVNHDIKNGLIPIRNVVRHLTEVARESPGELPAVFAERVGSLDSSIAYLDTLARNYARLTPDLGHRPCDVNGVVEDLAKEIPGRDITLRLASGLPAVRADPVVLRRILENLVGTAVESLEPEAGAGSVVTVSTGRVESSGDGQPSRVRITVADSGRGMTRGELDQAFDDFYTTKADGTGLGLSIVRRLIMDLNGSLRVETEPGRGTEVRVELPVA